MSLQTLGNVVIIVVLVGWICVRQLNWRPLVISQMWRFPVIMGVIGFFLLTRSGATRITSLDIAIFAIEIVLSLVIGSLMGRIAQIRPISRAAGPTPGASASAGASPAAFGRVGYSGQARSGSARATATLETRTGWVGMILWFVLIAVRVGMDVLASNMGDKLATSTGIILILLAANRIARVGVLAYRLERRPQVAA
jgi:hypothetical protein